MNQSVSDDVEKNFPLGQIFAWIFVLGLLVIVGIQLNESRKVTAAQGDKAPEFVLTTFEGDEYSFEDLRGKVIVLNIWASWCEPCKLEAADLQTAWEKYEPRGDVIFLGVDYVDTDKEAMEYIEQYSITYPNGPDFGRKIYLAFRATGVPETFIINQNGEIAYTKLGPFTSLNEITSAIDSLLSP